MSLLSLEGRDHRDLKLKPRVCRKMFTLILTFVFVILSGIAAKGPKVEFWVLSL